MNISVILAHPNKHSFNHAIAQTAVTQLRKNGHDVNFHDLYEEKFDPILPSQEIPNEAPLPKEIETHCQLVG
jgi:putative NADPH-quinone reductase